MIEALVLEPAFPAGTAFERGGEISIETGDVSTEGPTLGVRRGSGDLQALTDSRQRIIWFFKVFE